ncbi:hypothetical protein [Legionella bononiensis]|uniref:Uncharacterized protein n=1 Tax=Legionella bononiensis TaxID=2793102 RepID=A0ABS1W747_9GAMM|nr:hypothetical protein [Legionella bononiensis]MBL7481249.1 hypothetical protein [Legionella bononiensis]MBL7525155.1 hypothetical protein [Legionella bononiensis]MBL7562879.1 hypothetical protein [Legionella bononiensis]
MKPKLLSTLLVLFFVSTSACANSAQWCSLQQSQNNQLINSVPVAANDGARCSDGTRCATGYDYCCYINGTETCVKSLSDCKDE